ncbi:hypothetical protein AB0B44_43905, partial [Streptomyces sp. NPDC041003]
ERRCCTRPRCGSCPSPTTANCSPPPRNSSAAPPDLIADLLAGAGLAEVARLVREPDSLEKSPQGFLLARKG